MLGITAPQNHVVLYKVFVAPLTMKMMLIPLVHLPLFLGNPNISLYKKTIVEIQQIRVINAFIFNFLLGIFLNY